MKSNPEIIVDHSVSIQDSAYDLFGDMLLEKETKEICEEIESEKGTKAEADMKDFFIRNEQKHLQIIERNCHVSKGSLINRIHALHKIAQIAAVLIVCLALAGGIALAASPYVRMQLMELLAKTAPEYTRIEMAKSKTVETPLDWKGLYFPTVIPQGSFLNEYTSNTLYSKVYFSSGHSDGTWDFYFGEFSSSMSIQIDTENANQIETEIGHHNAIIMEKEGLISIYWTDGQRVLLVQTHHCSLDEAIKYAAGIEMVK